LAFNAKFVQVITQKYLEMANHKRLLFSSKQSPMIAKQMIASIVLSHSFELLLCMSKTND